MKTDRERMPIILRRSHSGLTPVSRIDADMLDEYALGSDVEVTIKKRRSLPQLRLYWAMLGNVVAATEDHPSADHLHDAIKDKLGYKTPMRRLDGSIAFIPDSVALTRMDGVQFKAFFDAAVKLLAETYGIDPLALSEAA